MSEKDFVVGFIVIATSVYAFCMGYILGRTDEFDANEKAKNGRERGGRREG